MMFTFLPAWGLSNAAATLVGQNLGARQPERAERSVWVTTKYNVLFLVVDRRRARRVRRRRSSASSRPIPRRCATAPTACASSATATASTPSGLIMVQAFNGAGDTRDADVAERCSASGCLQLPLAYALAEWLALGPHGVFWAAAIAESVLAVLAWSVFRRGTWKLKVV